jgi:hypothetical protein
MKSQPIFQEYGPKGGKRWRVISPGNREKISSGNQGFSRRIDLIKNATLTVLALLEVPEVWNAVKGKIAQKQALEAEEAAITGQYRTVTK